MRRIARFCYTAATPIIISIAIINIAALASFFYFELDTDFLNFFTSDNPKAADFNGLKEKDESHYIEEQEGKAKLAIKAML